MKKPALLTGGAAVCALALIVAGAATARPQANTIRVAAPMDAAQEVPQPRGDVDSARGTFGATVTRSGAGADMRWNMVFSGLTGPALQAHIHTGRPGDAGPVAVALCSPCVNPEEGTANLNAATLAAIQAGTAYVNIHTATNMPGEIRGQVDVIAGISTSLTPRREVPKPKGNVRRARGLFRGTVTKSGSVTRASLEAHVLAADGSRDRSTHPPRRPWDDRARRGRPLRAVQERRREDGEAAALDRRGARGRSRVRERAHAPEQARRDPRKHRASAALDSVAKDLRGPAPGARARAASAARPEHEQVLALVHDLPVRGVVRLEEVDPVAVQVLAPVAERVSQRLRRAVARREQLPVVLTGRDRQR